MNDKEIKTLLIDMVKDINKSYSEYYYEMTARGLPLEFISFAKGLEEAFIHRIDLTFKQDKCENCPYKQITESLKKLWGDPIK